MKKGLVLIEFHQCEKNWMIKLHMEEYLRENGYQIVTPDDIKNCDVIILTVCGNFDWTEMANLRQIRRVNRIKREDCIFIVTGCVPLIKSYLARYREVHDGPLINLLDMDKIGEAINAKVPVKDVPEPKFARDSVREKVLCRPSRYLWLFKLITLLRNTTISIKTKYGDFEYEKDRAGCANSLLTQFDECQVGSSVWNVPIGFGCRGECTYCAIRFSRRGLASRPKEEIIADIQEGVSRGFKWISLVSDSAGDYGQDINTNFGELLDEISTIPGDYHVVIDDFHAVDFIRYYPSVKALVVSGKLQKLMLGVQHVNVDILDKMKRQYDVALLKKYMKELSEISDPTILFSLHFIVAFPGETRKQFLELKKFTRWLFELNPQNLSYAFLYNPRENTVAAKFPGQIPILVKFARSAELVYESLKFKYLEDLKVVFDSPSINKKIANFFILHGIKIPCNLFEQFLWRLEGFLDYPEGLHEQDS